MNTKTPKTTVEILTGHKEEGKTMKANLLKAFALVAVLSLAACGGGGGDGGGTGSGGTGSFATMGGNDAEKQQTASKEARPVETTACTVILYGDSIMRGEPLVQEGPQRRMQRLRPNWTVELRAVAGQTGYEGAQKYLNEARPAPAVVAMQWGQNDTTYGTQVFPLRALIEKVRAEGSRSVLTGPPPRGDLIGAWLGVRAQIQTIAGETNTPVADWGSTPLPTLDGIHPTQASSNTLVDQLIAVIDQECDKLPPAEDVK